MRPPSTTWLAKFKDPARDCNGRLEAEALCEKVLTRSISQIINHSTKTTASHHANNSVRDTVENERCARETETKSVVHVIILLGRIVCAKHPAKTL